MRFFLTGLGNDCFILGYPFLCKFNPQIDWSLGSLTKGHVIISTLGREKPWEPREFRIKKLTTTQEWARNQRITEGKKTLKIVPKHYDEFAQVFNENLAKRFPPKRQEDLRIKLLPGAPTLINCKSYPLTQKETEVLKEFLKEEQHKGYIHMGSSPYTAPIFFVRKKDTDELYPVMDYQQLNKWTKRDHNPLPNMRMALKNLGNRKLFSKFNIHQGYKNLRIHLEDQYKATFKTMFRTFIPAVTYFSLTNVPPTFQRVVHQDLEPLLQKYPREFGNYLDNTWIVMNDDQKGIERHRQITWEHFSCSRINLIS